MKKNYVVLLAILSVCAVCSFNYLPNKKKEIKLLVFYKAARYYHDNIPDGVELIQNLGRQYSFKVDTTKNSAIFTKEKLKQYNVIVFLNTTGDVLSDTEQEEMTRWVQAGGGFVGVHSAGVTEFTWPWYHQLIGAFSSGHPSDPNVRNADLKVLNSKHISTKHLPKTWNCTDEWYNFKEIQPTIKVLINLDEKSYEGGTNGENHPITWYHEFDGGRVWYTGLGHTKECFKDKEFIKMLWGGIQYAAGRGK